LNFYVSLNAHFKTSYFNITLSCTGSIWEVSLHWLDNFLLYSVTDQDIFFCCIRSLIKIYSCLYSVTDQDIFVVVFGHWSRYILCCIRSLIKIYFLLYSVTDQDIFFVVFGHWSRYIFPGTWFMHRHVKKR
jgi:hypothetical protein